MNLRNAKLQKKRETRRTAIAAVAKKVVPKKPKRPAPDTVEEAMIRNLISSDADTSAMSLGEIHTLYALARIYKLLQVRAIAVDAFARLLTFDNFWEIVTTYNCKACAGIIRLCQSFIEKLDECQLDDLLSPERPEYQAFLKKAPAMFHALLQPAFEEYQWIAMKYYEKTAKSRKSAEFSTRAINPPTKSKKHLTEPPAKKAKPQPLAVSNASTSANSATTARRVVRMPEFDCVRVSTGTHDRYIIMGDDGEKRRFRFYTRDWRRATIEQVKTILAEVKEAVDDGHYEPCGSFIAQV